MKANKASSAMIGLIKSDMLIWATKMGTKPRSTCAAVSRLVSVSLP